MSLQTFSIGELAKLFNITPRSIRFYEEHRLIEPERKGQKRVYYVKDKVRLKLILRGKRLGFTLAEISKLFELYEVNSNSAAQLETMLLLTQTKRAVLEQQLTDIQTVLNELNDVELRCIEELNDIKRGVA